MQDELDRCKVELQRRRVEEDEIRVQVTRMSGLEYGDAAQQFGAKTGLGYREAAQQMEDKTMQTDEDALESVVQGAEADAKKGAVQGAATDGKQGVVQGAVRELEVQATWAEVAADRDRQWCQDATSRLRFINRFAQMDATGDLWAALRDAMDGRGNFVRTEVCEGLYRFDYKRPTAEEFVGSKRGGDREQSRAWLRREMRGLVVRETGEVVVRGLHKFFNVGQLDEVKIGQLRRLQVREVLGKLDGQMIVGVVVGDAVLYWSRKGHTAVGVTAGRIAKEARTGGGRHDELVKQVCGEGATPVFELVGQQSRIKSDEGKEPQLVLTAVRVQTTGEYWDYDRLQALAEQRQVAVVRRHRDMEQDGIQQVLDKVAGWRYKEGVVVRMSDGSMVKVKSDWWFKAGYTTRYREGRQSWQEQEQQRQEQQAQRRQTRGQRLAILRAVGVEKPVDVFQVLGQAEKVEAVYNGRGKLTVMMVSFGSNEEMLAAQVEARAKGWRAQQAYSRRTRGKLNRRLEVFRRE